RDHVRDLSGGGRITAPACQRFPPYTCARLVHCLDRADYSTGRSPRRGTDLPWLRSTKDDGRSPHTRPGSLAHESRIRLTTCRVSIHRLGNLLLSLPGDFCHWLRTRVDLSRVGPPPPSGRRALPLGCRAGRIRGWRLSKYLPLAHFALTAPDALKHC